MPRTGGLECGADRRAGPRALRRDPRDERVDLLYASRPAARHLLDTAVGYQTPLGPVRVVGLEGLIAFKLQGLVNDPRRTQDLEDMRALLRANRERVNLAQLREYFRLFEREDLLDEILRDAP